MAKWWALVFTLEKGQMAFLWAFVVAWLTEERQSGKEKVTSIAVHDIECLDE
jgi:hypothetical protein